MLYASSAVGQWTADKHPRGAHGRFGHGGGGSAKPVGRATVPSVGRAPVPTKATGRAAVPAPKKAAPRLPSESRTKVTYALGGGRYATASVTPKEKAFLRTAGRLIERPKAPAKKPPTKRAVPAAKKPRTAPGR
jgi:hypothetical protein